MLVLTNVNLRPYLQKVEQILKALEDPTLSATTKQLRIQDAKPNLDKITDHLIKGKDGATDLVFKAEIDSIVKFAYEEYERIVSSLMSQNTSPFPDPGMSAAGKLMEEYNAEPEMKNNDSVVDEFSKTLNGILNDNKVSSVKVVSEPVQSITASIGEPQVVAASRASNQPTNFNSPVMAESTPRRPAQIDLKEMIDEIKHHSDEGFFVFDAKGFNFFQEQEPLGEYLAANFNGKPLPLIIKGAQVRPKLKVTLEM